MLTQYFIDHYNKAFDLKVKGVSTEVMKIFSEYNWPGNIRELRHTIEHAMNLVENETIEKEHLPFLLFERLKVKPSKSVEQIVDIAVSEEIDDKGMDLKTVVELVEKETILSVLRKNEGNINDTAKKLGLSRQNLDYKMKKYGLTSTY